MQNINFIGSSQEDTRISNYFKQMGILKAENAKLLQENKAMKTLVFNQREEIKSLEDDTLKKDNALKALVNLYNEQTDLINELKKEKRVYYTYNDSIQIQNIEARKEESPALAYINTSTKFLGDILVQIFFQKMQGTSDNFLYNELEFSITEAPLFEGIENSQMEMKRIFKEYQEKYYDKCFDNGFKLPRKKQLHFQLLKVINKLVNF